LNLNGSIAIGGGLLAGLGGGLFLLETSALFHAFREAFKLLMIREPGPWKNTGDIASLAVAQAHRRCGLGSHLLKYALQDMESEQVKVINISLEAGGTGDFLHFLVP